MPRGCKKACAESKWGKRFLGGGRRRGRIIGGRPSFRSHHRPFQISGPLTFFGASFSAPQHQMSSFQKKKWRNVKREILYSMFFATSAGHIHISTDRSTPTQVTKTPNLFLSAVSQYGFFFKKCLYTARASSSSNRVFLSHTAGTNNPPPPPRLYYCSAVNKNSKQKRFISSNARYSLHTYAVSIHHRRTPIETKDEAA